MKKSLAIFALINLFAFGVFAGDYDAKTSCVMVYNKIDKMTPNLFIACDGELVLSHYVKLEKELENPSQFKEALFKAFQEIVDTQHTKSCKNYETEQIWWANCALVK